MKWANLPVHELVARYEAGESTRMLAHAYGVCRDTAWRTLRAAGVKMRRSGGQLGNKHALGGKGRPKRGGPLHVDGQGYFGTRDREGKRCGVHRGCWEAHHGPVPDGCVIHHINGDTLDNEIGNLCCMVDSEHRRMHATAVQAERQK